jgi:aminoglycoside 6'-N-acetyltransferase
MINRSRISFRRLTLDDMPLLYKWLHNPGVARWWVPMPESVTELEQKYGPRVHGEERVDCYVMEYDCEPIGFIQTYRLDTDPDYAAALDVDPHAAGVDLYIGEDAYQHRGFGPVLLRKFVDRVVFADPSISCCVIGPAVSNTAAIRAYEKAGFKHVKTVPVPGEDEPEYIMELLPATRATRRETSGGVR